MRQRVRYHEIVFDEGFLTAMRPDGEALRFTRQERALLLLFTAQPQRLFSRQELMTAIESEGADRNVDFVINRLRRKLSDTGPERRFISTQYGEGYVWVAPAAAVASETGFVVIGPVRGASGAEAQAVLTALQSALQARVAPDRRIALASDWGPRAAEAATYRFSIEVSFHGAGDRLDAGLVLREEPARTVVASFRESFRGGGSADALGELAAAIGDAAWKRLALGPAAAPTPTDPPLHLRMQTTSMLLDPPGVAWLSNREHIARMRAEDPTDPVAALMWAMHLFVRTALGLGDAPFSEAILTPIEQEIEHLVFESLPAIRDDPLMALAASKLLLGVHRGHEDLAQTLAETAFADSAAFAAAFPMLAQLAAYRGDMPEAIRLYDEGLRLCEAGSEFEVYVQFLKATALMAADDLAGVEVTFERIVRIKPAALPQVGLFFLPPGDLGLARKLQPLLDRTDLPHARKLVAYQYHLMARFFSGPGHPSNVMQGVLNHMVRRFGPGVASEELWSRIPADLHHMRTMARA